MPLQVASNGVGHGDPTGTDSRISVETLASTTHPSPPDATTRSVSPSPGPSVQPWSIRVALFRPLPLKRIALGAGTVCRTRSTVPERLSQIQISDGLTMGSLPPLQCRGGWIHLNGMGYRDGVEVIRCSRTADHSDGGARALCGVRCGRGNAQSLASRRLRAQAIALLLRVDASDSTGIPAVSPWGLHRWQACGPIRGQRRPCALRPEALYSAKTTRG